MHLERDLSLLHFNTFRLAVRAQAMLRVTHVRQLVQWLADKPQMQTSDMKKCIPNIFILGGGSNVVFTRDVSVPVLKIEIGGMRLLEHSSEQYVIEIGAGELWHDVVLWTLQRGYYGLENLALIPGTVGAAPVQNIGAYGVELSERLHSVDCFDYSTGKIFSLTNKDCNFSYRDSIFKHALSGRVIITHVRLCLQKKWRPTLNYKDIERKMEESGNWCPNAMQIFSWICAIRREKLPDPSILGSAGSFFKNPVVDANQAAMLVAREPKLVHYNLADGSVKLAAGWLVEACGWRNKRRGVVGVYEKQSLVLVNYGSGIGAEIMALAEEILTSVHQRFGVLLEIEPLVF
jgi:UDP-N-acetylmuramate dehydrogenase